MELLYVIQGDLLAWGDYTQAQLNSKHHVSSQVKTEVSISFSLLLRTTQRMAVYQSLCVSQEFKTVLKEVGKVRIQLIPLGNWAKPKLSSELSVGVPISYSKLMTLCALQGPSPHGPSNLQLSLWYFKYATSITAVKFHNHSPSKTL